MAAFLDPDPIASARTLVDFLKAKHPNVSLDLAKSVVCQLNPRVEEPDEAVAKRLRALLKGEGVSIKHTHSLHVVARLCHGSSWYQRRQRELFCTLIVTRLSDFEEVQIPGWPGAGDLLLEACQHWLQGTRGARVVAIRCAAGALVLSGQLPGKAELLPLVTVAPIRDDGVAVADWLKGFSSALERLRRGLEECGLAIVDGYAVGRHCEGPFHFPIDGPQTVTSNALNSELVLIRNDHAPFRGGFEIARGDELFCWAQLEKSLQGKPLTPITVDEEGVWQVGEARFEWQIITHRPGDFYPGLRLHALTQQQAQQLLHRYKRAKFILRELVHNGATERKSLDLYGMPAQFRVNVARVKHELAAAGMTWEQASAELGEPGTELKADLPAGLLISLLMKLHLKDPNSLFARPRRDQLLWVGYDETVRSILPRVQHVLYRVIPELPLDEREAAMEAIRDLSASIAMRCGIFNIEDPLPELVYSDDGEELRAALEAVGLTAYVGIMPRLMPIPNDVKWPKDAVPWAVGHTLYVEIDSWNVELKATGT